MDERENFEIESCEEVDEEEENGDDDEKEKNVACSVLCVRT